jgi:SAM-dependent methyltransferase
LEHAGETFEADHLGGYIVGGDPATSFPDLWNWLSEKYRSVLDIGCGEGHSTRYFRKHGMQAVGIDGVANPGVVQHDYTTGPWNPGRQFDVVWCCEFLEHVEEQFLPNLRTSFEASSKLIVFTHAFPGQAGYHHVNCRTEDYWRGYFASLGFVVNDGLTGYARGLAALNSDPNNHFTRAGLVAERH